MVRADEIGSKGKGGSIAFRNDDGCLLVKKYDTAFRTLVVGKWVLFDQDGVCLGHSKFFDQPVAVPPFEWVRQKLSEQKFLKKHGF